MSFNESKSRSRFLRNPNNKREDFDIKIAKENFYQGKDTKRRPNSKNQQIDHKKGKDGFRRNGKTHEHESRVVPRGIKPKLIDGEKIRFLHNYLKGFLPSNPTKLSQKDEQGFNVIIIEDGLKERLQKATEDNNLEAIALFKRNKSGMIKEVFGTHEPTVLLKASNVTVAGLTGIFRPVVLGEYYLLSDYVAWGLIFEEYKWAGYIKFTYRPLLFPTGTATFAYAIGVLDYTAATQLASITDALAFDTMKIFCVNADVVSPIKSKVEWIGHIQGMPDQQWLASFVDSTPVWLKFYNYAGIVGSLTYGIVDFEAKLTYRQSY